MRKHLSLVTNDPTPEQPKPVSPYGVPAASVCEAPALTDQPLAAFERDQVKRLIQQVKAASPRVRTAFLLELMN